MSAKMLVLPLLLLLHWTARAEIELLSSKEEPEPRSTSITLGIKNPNENVETQMILRYPGSAKTVVHSGQQKIMLSNEDATIVAFNFRAGTQANDSVAVALSQVGRLVYYFDLNHVIAQAVEMWKKNLDEGAFRVTDVTKDSIVLDYYVHYSGPENPNFQVVAHVLMDGNLRVNQNDIRALPR